MNIHELRYCRHLLQVVKDLHIERAAMSTILDRTKAEENRQTQQWRVVTAEMAADPVFRSAVEANSAAYFRRLEQAVKSEELLAALIRDHAGEDAVAQ